MSAAQSSAQSGAQSGAVSDPDTNSHPGPAPLLSILVISYNTREMTLECLRTIVAETRIAHEVIVVDNASNDGSAEAIAEEFPQFRLLAETDNHGFARANNIAAKYATGDYILLLNPDTLVLDGGIDKLMEFAEARPAAKIWGGMTLFADRSLNPASCWQRMTLWNIFCRSTGLAAMFKNSAIFNPEIYGGWDRGEVARVDIVTGCFLLLPRQLWEALGGFNLTYVMYGEEADLCHRAVSQFDADPHVTPDARIVHYGAASERVRADKMVRLANAKITLIRHHFSGWKRPFGLFMYRYGLWLRKVLTGLSARFRPNDRRREAAENWDQIWTRRGEWWQGYPDL